MVKPRLVGRTNSTPERTHSGTVEDFSHFFDSTRPLTVTQMSFFSRPSPRLGLSLIHNTLLWYFGLKTLVYKNHFVNAL